MGFMCGKDLPLYTSWPHHETWKDGTRFKQPLDIETGVINLNL